MIPVVVRSTEEMLKIVPNELREAAYALGVPKWRTIIKVVLPTSIAGIASGVTLAIARVIGETAPLLITVGSPRASTSTRSTGRMATLPVFAYNSYAAPGVPREPFIDRAWTAALVLIIIVMVLNLVARLIARAVRAQDPMRRTDQHGQERSRPRTSTSTTARSWPSRTSRCRSEPQTVTALIGPSGCGKSTFLRSINRMHEVIPGARVEGRPGARRPGPLRPGRRPGRRAPPDRHGLPAAQPVPHDVDLRQRDRRACGSTTSACKKDATDELVEQSLRGANLWNEVKDRLDKPGSGLSGGQQQRLCIARAIAVQPDVLLMDEPCSALDPISTLAIEDLINELKNEYTIVIVTHNMQQAARVSDYTGFFNIEGTGKPGHLVEMDETKTIFSQPEREGDRGLRVGPLRLIPSPRTGRGQIGIASGSSPVTA